MNDMKLIVDGKEVELTPVREVMREIDWGWSHPIAKHLKHALWCWRVQPTARLTAVRGYPKSAILPRGVIRECVELIKKAQRQQFNETMNAALGFSDLTSDEPATAGTTVVINEPAPIRKVEITGTLSLDGDDHEAD